MLRTLMLFGAKNKLLAFGLLIAGTLAFGFGLTKLRVETSLDLMFSENDPSLKRYDEVIKAFGSDNATVIYLRDAKLFTPEKLRLVEKLVDDLSQVDAVERVDSLFSLTNVKDRAGSLDSRTVLQSTPATLAEAEQAKQDALGNPLLRRNFISEDGKVMAINVIIKKPPDTRTEINDGASIAFDKLLEPLRPQFEQVFQLGPSRIGFDFKRGMANDVVKLVPISMLLLLVTVMLFLRSSRLGVIPLVTSSLSLIWTFGFMGWANIPANLLMAMLPSLLIVVGSTEDIHMCSGYLEGFDNREGGTRMHGIEKMASHMGLPIVVTSVTTVLGFLANCISDIRLISDFSYAAAFGIGINTVVTYLSLPLMLAVFGPVPKRGETRESREAFVGRSGQFVAWLVSRAQIYPRATLTITALVVALFAGLSTRVTVSNDPLSFFSGDHPMVRDSQTLHRDLSGVQIFYITLSTGRQDAFLEPENLRIVEKIQRTIASTPDFDKSQSIVDHLSLVNREMKGGAAELYRLPDSRNLVEQYLLFFQRSDIAPYVSARFDSANIVVRHNIHDSHTSLRVVGELEKKAREIAGPHVKVDFVGKNLMINRAAEELVWNELQSMLLTLLTVLVTMAVMFQSLKAGIISMVPNVLPIILTYGSMPLLGIPVNPATAMAASIAIGIAIDDTTHMLLRYNAEFSDASSTAVAVRRAISAETVPVISSALALTAGFLALCGSNFTIIVQFGILSALTMIYAVLADLLVLPLLLKHLRVVVVWDLLRQSVSKEVVEHCPLFTGMTEREIKRVILLSKIVPYADGKTLVREGASDRDMYLLLKGHAVVSQNHSGRAREIATLGPGSVFGEVSFVDAVSRSASVTAQGPVEVLAFNHQSLSASLGNHPRLAMQIHANLNRILGRRLAQTTSEWGLARADLSMMHRRETGSSGNV